MQDLFMNIPEELKKEGFFCSRRNKIPNAKPNDRNTFRSYDEIIRNLKNGEGIGIGFFDDFCGIDIDHCIDDEGRLSPIAEEMLSKFDSYAEKSMSGKGIHILFKCRNQKNYGNEKYYTKMNGDQCLENGIKDTGGFELYQGRYDERYFALTGNAINHKGIGVVDATLITYVKETYMKRPEKVVPERKREPLNIGVGNKDYLQDALERGNDTKLLSLWNAIPSGKGGDESETDLALLDKLAYYCNRDATQMRIAFEESPYFSRKDEHHKKKWNRKDYSEDTIRKAVSSCVRTAKEDEEEFLSKKESYKENLPEGKTDQMKVEGEIDRLRNSFDSMDEFFNTIKKGVFQPIPTGYKPFDDALQGGLSNQSICVLTGGTSTGKTTFVLNLCMELAKERPIIYFTLEMSKEQILSKLYSATGYRVKGLSLSSNTILQGKMSKAQDVLLQESIYQYKALRNIYVTFPEEPTIDYIRTCLDGIVEKLKEEGKTHPVVVIDYLQFIQGNPKEDVQSLIKRIQRTMKKFCVDNESIVILLSANARDKNKGQSQVDSGRDTSDIEYSADYLLSLNFYEWEHKTNESATRQDLIKNNPRNMTVTIHKNRFGASGQMVDFEFNGITNTFKVVNQEKQNEYEDVF